MREYQRRGGVGQGVENILQIQQQVCRVSRSFRLAPLELQNLLVFNLGSEAGIDCGVLTPMACRLYGQKLLLTVHRRGRESGRRNKHVTSTEWYCLDVVAKPDETGNWDILPDLQKDFSEIRSQISNDISKKIFRLVKKDVQMDLDSCMDKHLDIKVRYPKISMDMSGYLWVAKFKYGYRKCQGSSWKCIHITRKLRMNDGGSLGECYNQEFLNDE